MGVYQEFLGPVAHAAVALGGALLAIAGLQQVFNACGIGGVILALFALSFTCSVAARMLERRGR